MVAGYILATYFFMAINLLVRPIGHPTKYGYRGMMATYSDNGEINYHWQEFATEDEYESAFHEAENYICNRTNIIPITSVEDIDETEAVETKE